MAIIAQYQTYYGVHLDHWNEAWGDVNHNKILVKSMPDEEVRSTASTAIASTVSFIYPMLVSNKYYIDGIADGHFKVGNSDYAWGASSTPTTITTFTAELTTLSNTGVYTALASTTTTISYSVASDYVALPFYLNVIEKEISENEKLILTVSVTYPDDGNFLFLSHDTVTTTGYDVKIRIPYAPSSGGG